MLVNDNGARADGGGKSEEKKEEEEERAGEGWGTGRWEGF